MYLRLSSKIYDKIVQNENYKRIVNDERLKILGHIIVANVTRFRFLNVI